MQAKVIKRICEQFTSMFGLVVIDGQIFSTKNNCKVSDNWCKCSLIKYFDDVDAKSVDSIIATLKLLECENKAEYTIASLNGLKAQSRDQYDEATIEQLKLVFGDKLESMINWAHLVLIGNTPKQALNIYGPSNYGKSYFVDNSFGRIFSTCIGDWRGDWTIQHATDETQVIMFTDKDEGGIKSKQWEFIKKTHQGRRVFVEINPKCGAKYEINAALTSIIQTQAPIRLDAPYGWENDAKLAAEHTLECEALSNRVLMVEFKVDSRNFDWNWDTIYSIIVKGDLN